MSDQDLTVNTIFWKDGSHTVLHLDDHDTAILNKSFADQGMVEAGPPVRNVWERECDEPFYVHVLISHIAMLWEGAHPGIFDDLC